MDIQEAPKFIKLHHQFMIFRCFLYRKYSFKIHTITSIRNSIFSKQIERSGKNYKNTFEKQNQEMSEGFKADQFTLSCSKNLKLFDEVHVREVA